MGIIEDIIRDMNSGLYDFTDNGRCTGCGSCCSNFLPLSKKDISRIRKYIKSHNIIPCNHYTPVASSIDATCPFRDDVKKVCTIYSVRPDICRDFKCDKAKKGYMPSKKMFSDKYEITVVRKLFFGGEEDVSVLQGCQR